MKCQGCDGTGGPSKSCAGCGGSGVQPANAGRWVPWSVGDEVPEGAVFWTAYRTHNFSFLMHGPHKPLSFVPAQVVAYWSVALPPAFDPQEGMAFHRDRPIVADEQYDGPMRLSVPFDNPDPEFNALGAMVAVLKTPIVVRPGDDPRPIGETLSNAQRDRVVRYLFSRFAIDPTTGGN